MDPLLDDFQVFLQQMKAKQEQVAGQGEAVRAKVYREIAEELFVLMDKHTDGQASKQEFE